MADINSTLSKELLHEYFEYRNGELYWKKSTANCIQIGDKVGCIDKTNEYCRLRFKNKNYNVHQLVFFMHHGFAPAVIDHIDCNKTNNKIENLRQADNYTNQQNQKISKKNICGYKNVTWRAARGKWYVRIKANGKYITRGGFDDPEEASIVATKLREELFGSFANHG